MDIGNAQQPPLREYRIGYIVGDEHESAKRFFDPLYTLDEAKMTLAAMQRADARQVPKGGLGSSDRPVYPTNYFYEKVEPEEKEERS